MDDRVFLIAGASSGHRRRHGPRGGRPGYRLVLAARSQDKLRALAEETGGPGPARPRLDVDRLRTTRATRRAHALDAHGRIDVVFANAGIGFPRGFTEGDPDQAKDVVVFTNVYGIYADDPRDGGRCCEPAAGIS